MPTKLFDSRRLASCGCFVEMMTASATMLLCGVVLGANRPWRLRDKLRLLLRKQPSDRPLSLRPLGERLSAIAPFVLASLLNVVSERVL